MTGREKVELKNKIETQLTFANYVDVNLDNSKWISVFVTVDNALMPAVERIASIHGQASMEWEADGWNMNNEISQHSATFYINI
jgi:hypothetical protein